MHFETNRLVYKNSVHILLCTGLLKCWVVFIHVHCKKLNATKMSMMWKKGVSVVFVALRIFRLQKFIIAMNEKYAYSSFKAGRVKWKWFRFFYNLYCPKVLMALHLHCGTFDSSNSSLLENWSCVEFLL